MKKLKQMLCVTVSLLMAVAPALASAEVVKNEIIYATYDADGANAEYVVVNRFDVDTAQWLADYGDYTEITNLTNEQALHQEGDKISVQVEPGTFYYEGTLRNAELPWTIGLQFLYNGAPIAPAELAGKRGTVEIILSVKRNEACDKDYFDHYALSIATSFDTENCTNIKAQGGILANVGKSKQVSYTVVPGSEEEFHITMYASQFAMEPLTLNGVPLTLDTGSIDTGSAKSDLSDLEQGAVDLDEGAYDLSDGVDELVEGADSLYTGSGEVSVAMRTLSSAANTLDQGNTSVTEGIDELAKAVKTLSGFNKEILDGAKALTDTNTQSLISQMDTGLQSYAAALPPKTEALKTAVTALSGKVTGLPTAIKTIGDNLQSAYNLLASISTSAGGNLSEATASIEEVIQMLGQAKTSLAGSMDGTVSAQFDAAIAKLESASSKISTVTTALGSKDPASYQGALAILQSCINTMTTAGEKNDTLYAQALALSGAFNDQTKGLTASVNAYADAVDAYMGLVGNYRTAMGAVNTGAVSLAGGIQGYVSGADKLYAGIKTLQTSYQTMSDGIGAFTGGVRKLASNYQTLDTGVQTLVDGVDELADGVVELTDGTFQLRDRTTGAPERVDEEVDKALEKFHNDDYVAASFLSPKNHPQQVQFVIKYRGVELPEAEPEEETAEPTEETPIDRLLNLFHK